MFVPCHSQFVVSLREQDSSVFQNCVLMFDGKIPKINDGWQLIKYSLLVVIRSRVMSNTPSLCPSHMWRFYPATSTMADEGSISLEFQFWWISIYYIRIQLLWLTRRPSIYVIIHRSPDTPTKDPTISHDIYIYMCIYIYIYIYHISYIPSHRTPIIHPWYSHNIFQ